MTSGASKTKPLSKNEKRRQRKKQLKKELDAEAERLKKLQEASNASESVEYVTEDLLSNPQIAGDMKTILVNFKSLPGVYEEENKDNDENKDTSKTIKSDSGDMLDDPTLPKKLTKSQRRLNRLTVAELKQLVDRPDVVEEHDVNSPDPKLLIMLKSYRNTVPVPSNWSETRKFLANKRGIERVGYELPPHIAATGIGEMRSTILEQDSEKSIKQKLRGKMHAKQSKMELDYQMVYDAFYKMATKPPMSEHGEVYFEGKEFEVKFKTKRPGDLSDELREALGMVSENAPPPWLSNMQRFGPPPAYPNMRIPGVNYPIPEGCRYGLGPNEWGKPPIDAFGNPLYGDVFGTSKSENSTHTFTDGSLWGTFDEEAPSESEEENMSESNEDSEDDSDEETVVPIEHIQLRKNEYSDVNTVKEMENKNDLLTEQVSISLDPEELGSLDAASLKRKYEQQLAANKGESDNVEQENSKRRKVGKSKFKF